MLLADSIIHQSTCKYSVSVDDGQACFSLQVERSSCILSTVTNAVDIVQRMVEDAVLIILTLRDPQIAPRVGRTKIHHGF